MSTTMEPAPPADSAWRWWESRRFRYNVGLAAAGALAWALVAAESLLLTGLISMSVSLTLASGLMWLVAMGVANLLFFLGPLSERLLQPDDPEAYRRRVFGLGFWFSVAVPFLVPAVVLIAIVGSLGY